jgi:predicted nucleotidyltransferase
MTPWAVTPEKIDSVIQRIIVAARPRKIIVFGSVVRGELHGDSDLDLLVVTREESENPRAESVQLRRALRGISMPVDVLVISEGRLAQLADEPGLIYREAIRHGWVVYSDPQAEHGGTKSRLSLRSSCSREKSRHLVPDYS